MSCCACIWFINWLSRKKYTELTNEHEPAITFEEYMTRVNYSAIAEDFRLVKIATLAITLLLCCFITILCITFILFKGDSRLPSAVSMSIGPLLLAATFGWHLYKNVGRMYEKLPNPYEIIFHV